jgi:hypothetical protein
LTANKRKTSWFYTLLGYVVIATALVIAAFLLGAVLYYSGLALLMGSMPKDTFAKWMFFVMYTAVLFGSLIRISRPRWRNKVFWWTFAVLFLLHAMGFLIASSYIRFWRKPYGYYLFFGGLPIEGAVVMTVLEWAWERFSVGKHAHQSVQTGIREEH